MTDGECLARIAKRLPGSRIVHDPGRSSPEASWSVVLADGTVACRVTFAQVMNSTQRWRAIEYESFPETACATELKGLLLAGVDDFVERLVKERVTRKPWWRRALERLGLRREHPRAREGPRGPTEERG